MECPTTIMRPSAAALIRLRAGRNLKVIAREMGIDWRTLFGLENGEGTERMQYNTLNIIARYYKVSIEDIIEPSPDQSDAWLGRRKPTTRAASL